MYIICNCDIAIRTFYNSDIFYNVEKKILITHYLALLCMENHKNIVMIYLVVPYEL